MSFYNKHNRKNSDGTFIVAPVYGCTDPEANNYNALATVDDGTCTYDEYLPGCTDPDANNYDPSATTDDGTCTYDTDIPGCTDPSANNYDPSATVDNGTCTYDGVPVPNYIDIICSTYITDTVEYSAGLFFDSYVEDCNVNTNRPVFIALHAGGGVRGDFDPRTYAKEFASRGYFALSADYGETAPSYTLSKQKQNVANVCALIRYLRANAATYGINPLNVFIGGVSAGALTAATTNVASDDLDAGVVYWSNAMNTQNSGESSVPTATFSQSGTVAPNLYDWITGADKPHYFYHGTIDCTMSYSLAQCPMKGKGALDCYNKMISVGIPATLVPYIGDDHTIGIHHDGIMLGGDLQIDGVTVDPGVVAKFAALIV